MRPAHQRTAFLTGRALAAELVAQLAPGRPTDVDSTCAVCGGPHGVPRAVHAPVHLSIAHADRLVIAAAIPSGAAGALGVDIEATDAPDAPRTDLTALFAPAPPPTLRGWTRIEAVLKADGRGLRIAPGTVRFDGADTAVLEGRSFELSDVPGLPPGYVASVALG